MAATATPEEAIVIALHQLEASADQVSFELPGVTFRIHRHFRWGYDCCGGVLATPGRTGIFADIVPFGTFSVWDSLAEEN